MENTFLTRKANGETILISELLAAPPSDDVLMEVFPYSRDSRPYISQTGLKILKLRLDGLNDAEAGKKLALTREQTARRFQKVKNKLTKQPIPDYIEIDTLGLRRLRGLEVTLSSGCTKLSELLRDMPSDQDLAELYIARGNIPGIKHRRKLNNEDLSLLQKKAAGQRNADIARELGVRPEAVRRQLKWIRTALSQRLCIEIDMPELFPFDADEIG